MSIMPFSGETAKADVAGGHVRSNSVCSCRMLSLAVFIAMCVYIYIHRYVGGMQWVGNGTTFHGQRIDYGGCALPRISIPVVWARHSTYMPNPDNVAGKRERETMNE